MAVGDPGVLGHNVPEHVVVEYRFRKENAPIQLHSLTENIVWVKGRKLKFVIRL